MPLAITARKQLFYVRTGLPLSLAQQVLQDAPVRTNVAPLVDIIIRLSRT